MRYTRAIEPCSAFSENDQLTKNHKMNLTNFYPNLSVQDAAQTFRAHTLETGLQMYQNGWSIIGSYFKTPKLHPWKAPSKEELASWAVSDFQSGRANSINLRLTDSDVIALDCDFPSPELTQKFINALPCLLSLMPNRLYTCAGGKGCKVFFRYFSEIQAPNKLGVTAYSPDTNQKHELEIKTTLSTVLGMHSALGDAQGRLIDYTVYSWYPNTNSIATAKPSDLPSIRNFELLAIESLYNTLIQGAGFCNEQGKPLTNATHFNLLFSSLCMFAQGYLWDANQERIPVNELKVTAEDIAYVSHAFISLGLADALECLKHIFLGQELTNDRLVSVCGRFYSQVLLSDSNWQVIEHMASFAVKAFTAFETGCLKRRAREVGMSEVKGDVFALTRTMMQEYEKRRH